MFFVRGDEVKHCTAPSRECDHEHHLCLATASRIISEKFNREYHIAKNGEIERCDSPELCLIPEHFDKRAEAVGYHRDTYDFSGPWRAKFNPYTSLLEGELADFVEKLGFRTVRNSRKVIAPFELDVYLPDRNVALEFNGAHWHSEEVIQKRYKMSSQAYHRNKFDMCAERGITLGYVWEQNWLQDWVTVTDAVSDLIQYQRHLPLLEQFSKPLSPSTVFWESIDRTGMIKTRRKIEKRLKKERGLP